MNQHPMTKAYIKAFVKNGGKEFKNKFNPFVLDQTIIFGYRKFYFRVVCAASVPSWDAEAMPKGVTDSSDMIMIKQPDFADWLPCDAQAKADFARFEAIVKNTVAKYV